MILLHYEAFDVLVKAEGFEMKFALSWHERRRREAILVEIEINWSRDQLLSVNPRNAKEDKNSFNLPLSRLNNPLLWSFEESACREE